MWMEHEKKKEEQHQRKLERDRRAKEKYREKNRELLREQAKAYYQKKKEGLERGNVVSDGTCSVP